MTATLKSKQTSIAMVRYHLLPVAFLLTPLIFHYPLPLSKGQVTYNFEPVAFRNEYGSKVGMPKGPASKQKGFLEGLKPLRVLG